MHTRLDTILRNQKTIINMLTVLMAQGGKEMKEFDDLKAAVAAETTVDQSAVALLDGLTKAVADLAAKYADSPAAADLEALATQLTTDQAALAAAVVANTPAAPAA